MDARSLRNTLKVLREAGVSRFKTADLEVEFATDSNNRHIPLTQDRQSTSAGAHSQSANSESIHQVAPAVDTRETPGKRLGKLLFAHEDVA